jgi:hypothetical protein
MTAGFVIAQVDRGCGEAQPQHVRIRQRVRLILNPFAFEGLTN